MIMLALLFAGNRAVLCAAQTSLTVIPDLVFSQQGNDDSNFYNLPEKERRITAYPLQPGFEVGVETSRSLVALHYTLNAHYDNRKGEKNLYGHTALLPGEVEITDRIDSDNKDPLAYSQDTAQRDPTGTPASRKKYSQNRFSPLQLTVIPNFLFSQQVSYDSNFYYLPEKERSVTTYLVQPGIEVGIETPRSLVALHYTLNAHYYNQKGEDNFYGHTALLLGEVEITERVSLEVKDRFIYSRDPAQLDPIGTPASRKKYYQNRFSPSLSYHFEPKFTVQVGYQNWITDYDDSDLEDAVGNQGSIDLIYHLDRSAALDLEYQYWKMDYDGSTPDYTSQTLSLIARKEWRLIALEAGFGYHNRDFDESGLKDNDTFIYRLTLDGTSTSGRTRFSLSGQQNYNYLGFHSNDYYKAYRFAGKLDYELTVRISSRIKGSYQNDDYINSNREDDIYAISAEMGYLIKEWLELNGSIGYEKRNSSISFEDYDKTLALLKLRFDYDLGDR
jgi:hypothetical protein